LARVNAGTFWDNVEYLMEDFCIVDSSADGAQVPSARLIVQLDLDQWMSKFGRSDEADEGVAPPVAAATHASVGTYVRQVSNASGASRPKSAAAVGIDKKHPVAKMGALQLANQGDCPCSMFLTAEIFDADGDPVYAGVASNDGFVQKIKEVSLQVERMFWQAGENETAPLAAYHRMHLMHSQANQDKVIGPGKGRIPGDKFIPNFAAAIRQDYPSFTPCVELYNCKTLENFSTTSCVGALVFNNYVFFSFSHLLVTNHFPRVCPFAELTFEYTFADDSQPMLLSAPQLTVIHAWLEKLFSIESLTLPSMLEEICRLFGGNFRDAETVVGVGFTYMWVDADGNPLMAMHKPGTIASNKFTTRARPLGLYAPGGKHFRYVPMGHVHMKSQTVSIT
jgi:hypothetical protein